jgi:hypothetical protein
VVFARRFDELVVAPPPDSPLLRVSRLGRYGVHRWAGVGLNLRVSSRFVGRVEYRIDLVSLAEQPEGIQRLIAGLGVVF